MDYFRVILIWLILGLIGVGAQAAEQCVSYVLVAKNYIGVTLTGKGSSPEKAGQDWADQARIDGPPRWYSYTVKSCTSVGCTLVRKVVSEDGWEVNVDEGYRVDAIDGDCPPPTPNCGYGKSYAGQSVTFKNLTSEQVNSLPSTIQGCASGCKVQVSGGNIGICIEGKCDVPYKKITSGGGSCDGSEVPVVLANNPPNPDVCQGEVNGVTIEVPCGDKTISKGEGETKVITNPDGSQETQTSTYTLDCNYPGDLCVYTENYTIVKGGSGPGGTGPGSETLSGSSQGTTTVKAFCEKHPADPACKITSDKEKESKDSTFGGGCSGPGGSFSCSGDAATCAIAKAVNEAKCITDWFFDDTSARAQSLGEDTIGGGRPADHPYNNKQSISAGMFDKTNNWGQSCPVDFSINSGPIHFTIPVSEWCDVLAVMGYAMVAITLLASARFVFGGIL